MRRDRRAVCAARQLAVFPPERPGNKRADLKDSGNSCITACPAIWAADLPGRSGREHILAVDRGAIGGGHYQWLCMWRGRGAMCTTPEQALLPAKRGRD